MNDDYGLESELYTAMYEETDWLGLPQLNMERIHGAGRRRRVVMAGSGMIAALVGATAVTLAVGGSGTGGSGGNGGSGASGSVVAAESSTPSSGATSPFSDVAAGVARSPGMASSVLCDHIPTMKPTSPSSGSPSQPSTMASTLQVSNGNCHIVFDTGPYSKSPSAPTVRIVPSPLIPGK